MSRVCSFAAVALAVSGCCFGGIPTSPPGPMPVPPPVAIAPPLPQGLATIAVAPGFAPDPTALPGLAGGPVSATSMSPGCYGSVPASPQVTLRVVAPMPSLVVVVESESDTTLVIRRPDGTYLCDDDGGSGLNPRVQAAFAPGDYAVYVGVLGGSGASDTPYAIGVTTIPAMDAHVVTGTPLRVGRFRVVSASGATGIQAGALCDYVQVGIAMRVSGYDVRWRVACNGVPIYGESGGFQYRQRPEWPAGTVVLDAATTASDNDPLFTWDASGIRIADDELGHLGVYSLVLEDVPSQPI